MMGGDGCGMGMMGGHPYIAGRIAFLKAELGITDKQEEAFKGLTDVMKSHVEGRQERREEMWQAMQSAKSPAEVIDARIKIMETRVGMMKEMKEALDKLYGELTDEQKQKANAILPPMGGLGCMMR